MADRLPANLAAVDPADAWKPWSPTTGEPWNRKWAAHFFRRAAFGAKPADLDRALADGYDKTLARLLTGDDSDRSGSLNLETLIEAGQHFNDPNNLRAWWLYAMNESAHPLREKLTLFWHNHFATSYAKIRSTRLMYEQNVALRTHALGKFRPFLLDMSKDTAMLVWLDSNRNEKGAANENFAREVMELFSLGVGNYTEKDIQEAARAFTGWHHDAGQTTFEYHAAAHDEGMKTVLGQTGMWTGSDVIRICCDQPACARFIVGKLYAFLVSETPPPKGLLTPLEERFRKSDCDIADLVGAMLGSRLFFSPHAYRKRVKWPVEFALEAIRAVTPNRVPMGDVVPPLAKMGQVLFSPPNVKGWRTGQDWLNSATLLARNNFAETVAMGAWSDAAARRNRGAYAVRDEAEVPVEPQEAVPYHETAMTAVAGGTAVGAIRANYSILDQGGMNFLVTKNLHASPEAAKQQPPPAPNAHVDPVVTLYASKPKDIPTLVARMGELLYGERVPEKVTAKLEKYLREPIAVKVPEKEKKAPNKKEPPASELPPSEVKADPKTGMSIVPVGGIVMWAPALPGVPADVYLSRADVLDFKPDLHKPKQFQLTGKMTGKMQITFVFKNFPRVTFDVTVKTLEKTPTPAEFDSAEFKARVREALHAMMCLPEYQLN